MSSWAPVDTQSLADRHALRVTRKVRTIPAAPVPATRVGHRYRVAGTTSVSSAHSIFSR